MLCLTTRWSTVNTIATIADILRVRRRSWTASAAIADRIGAATIGSSLTLVLSAQSARQQTMQTRSSQGSASDASSLSQILAAFATKITATAQMSVDIRFVVDVLPMENRVEIPGRGLVPISEIHQDSTRSACGSADHVERREITARVYLGNIIDLAVHLLGVTPESKRKERQLNHNCILLVHATCGEQARSVTDKL